MMCADGQTHLATWFVCHLLLLRGDALQIVV